MSKVKRAVKQLRWSVELRGVGGTAALMARRLLRQDPHATPKQYQVHPFDTENGVETGGRIGGAHLGSGHAHDVYNVAYQGTPPSRLQNGIRQWREIAEQQPGARPLEEYAFFDIGCGKGRAIMLASEFPFREVSGVELDAELAQIGQQNLEAWEKTGKAKQTVRLLHGDALEVSLPEPPFVVWLYNPFRGPVLRKLLERLHAHAGAREGEIDVLYVVPDYREEFERSPNFQKLWEGGVRMSDEDQRWDDSDAEDLGQLWRR